jgi:hypothetical protein
MRQILVLPCIDDSRVKERLELAIISVGLLRTVGIPTLDASLRFAYAI